ncbi:hypothetical protein GOBAR_AA17239 [Gossypium barbadense]|uniref:Uncharacterized protein n=1 Tax=Gossypium barbadense TaxID=3634 RepID=A0A2P5XJ86_GOSBA|nr:hypothetical protein GOBAR_AA17239 [Gossypium barbadense]
MLSKFISVPETHFQNTEIVLMNQQASIQGLETQIGQLSKLISERPQGSLPSNTEPNLREQLNAINVQDEEGFVEPEPEPRQETVEISLKEVHEPLPNNSRGSVYEERRLQIKELDEWRTHKLRTHDKSKLRQNEPDTSLNQLKVGDKVLLDAANPHIVTTTPNKEIPFMVLRIFPFGFPHRHNKAHGSAYGSVKVGQGFPQHGYTMSSSRGKKTAVPTSKKRKGTSSSTCPTAKIQQVQLADSIRALLTTVPWELFFRIIKLTYLELTMELCSTFHLQTIMTNYDDPSTIQFRLGKLICQLSVLKFGATLRAPQHCGPRIIPHPHRPDYRLAQSTEEEAYEDIPDDVPPQHEDPPTQPPPPSHPIHAATSYADISECLTRFEQQCFQ